MTDRTEELLAYLGDRLDADARAALERDLAASPELRTELVGLSGLRAALLADRAPAVVPAAVWDRLDADAAGPPPTPQELPPPIPLAPARRRRRGRPWALAAAAAALLVAAGGAVGLLLADDDDQSTSPSPSTVSGESPAPGVDTSPVPTTDDPLSAPPIVALRSASAQLVAARSATFDVHGTGTARLRGLLGQEGFDADVGVELSGDAAVVFGQEGEPSDYRVAIEFEGVSGPIAFRPERTTSEVVVVDGVHYDSDDGAPFATVDPDDSDEGLFAQVVVRPDLLARLPEMAQGEVEDLGVTDIGGVTARHLRFRLRPGALGETAESTDVAEVWIAADGGVQQVRFETTGPIPDLDEADEATIELQVDITLGETGEPTEILPPT